MRHWTVIVEPTSWTRREQAVEAGQVPGRWRWGLEFGEVARESAVVSRGALGKPGRGGAALVSRERVGVGAAAAALHPVQGPSVDGLVPVLAEESPAADQTGPQREEHDHQQRAEGHAEQQGLVVHGHRRVIVLLTAAVGLGRGAATVHGLATALRRTREPVVPLAELVRVPIAVLAAQHFMAFFRQHRNFHRCVTTAETLSLMEPGCSSSSSNRKPGIPRSSLRRRPAKCLGVPAFPSPRPLRLS